MKNYSVTIGKYECIVFVTRHGGPKFIDSSYTFEALIGGVIAIPLKTAIENELVQDLHCVMSLDPVKELPIIAFEETKNELTWLLGERSK